MLHLSVVKFRCLYEMKLRNMYICSELYNFRKCPYATYICNVKQNIVDNGSITIDLD